MAPSKNKYYLEETTYSKEEVEALLKGASSSSVHSSSAIVTWGTENPYNSFAVVTLKVMSAFSEPEEESTKKIIANNMDWVLGQLDQSAQDKNNPNKVAFQASIIIRGLMAEIEKLKLDSAPL